MIRKILAISAAFVLVAFGAATTFSQSGQTSEFQAISRQEIELLMSDLAAKNPLAIRQLSTDPVLKTKQLDGLRQLLAFARQAEKDGLADKKRQELADVRLEVIASKYDSEINKKTPAKPQFSSITAEQVKEFWADETQKALREAEFQKFLDSKIDLLKQQDPRVNDKISEDDRQQARDFFAKVRIYSGEYTAKADKGLLATEFVRKTNLQVKLQQAQILARAYSESVADKAKVTDPEIAQYMEQHPELDPNTKKTKALEILKRAKAGEDFASLANQFTEDPGNKGSQGQLNGGLYKDVPKGTMVAPFEKAALALEPGQIAPDLVESDFGFHIIKLEKKADTKDANGDPTQVYDVRHILIDTTVTDPDNASSRRLPVREYITQKLSAEKQKKLIDDIVAANHISVPDDFTVPSVGDNLPVKAAKRTIRSATGRSTVVHKPAVRPRKRSVKKGLKRSRLVK